MNKVQKITSSDLKSTEWVSFSDDVVSILHDIFFHIQVLWKHSGPKSDNKNPQIFSLSILPMSEIDVIIQ